MFDSAKKVQNAASVAGQPANYQRVTRQANRYAEAVISEKPEEKAAAMLVTPAKTCLDMGGMGGMGYRPNDVISFLLVAVRH